MLIHGRAHNRNYHCNIEFKDCGQGESYVGAAAVYATIYYSKAIFDNNINDADGDNGEIKVIFYWPYAGDSEFVPADDYDPSEVRISEDYFTDNNINTWNPGYDSVRHNHAHLIHYELGYEEDYWPDGEPSGLGWHSEMDTTPDGTEIEWAFVDGFADFWSAITDVVSGTYTLQDDIVYFDPDNCPNGIHIETDVWDQLIYGSGDLTGVVGEKTEGFIANLLWDMIDNSSYLDLNPNVDDDPMDLTLNNIWNVMNIDSVHTILDFWDHSMYQPIYANAQGLFVM